jgi:TonB family protein
MRPPVLFCSLCLFLLVSSKIIASPSDWAEAPKPAYPLNAALEGTTGEVRLHVVVSGDGRVRQAEIVKSSGKRELDYAARAAVLKWRLQRSRIQPRDLNPGRDVIVSFQETEKERRIAAAVLRRASQKGSAWKEGGFFAFPPDAVYPAAQKTARIRFTIASDGHPRAVQLIQSSGSLSLDAAAMQGIQTWTAYPEWVGETAEVPVTFEGPRGPGSARPPPTESNLPRDWRHYIVEYPKPEYPYEARARHITGSGLYLITFSRDGHAEKVQVLQSTGSAILDSAVVQAFQKWHAVANPPFAQAKVPVTFSMSRVVDAGRWRLGQPQLVGPRH